MTERVHHEYLAGEWTAVAGDGFLAVVEPDAAAHVVDGLWQVAREGGDVLAALGVVTADGFAALPRFAVVRAADDGGVHAVLRGPVRLRLHGSDGAQDVAAGDAAVWTEHRAVGVQGLALTAGGTGDADDAAWWPLVGGVVRAGGLRTGRATEAPVVPDTATHEQPVVPAPPAPVAVGDADADPGVVLPDAVADPGVVPDEVAAGGGTADEARPAASQAEPATGPVDDQEPAGWSTADEAWPATASASPDAWPATAPVTVDADVPAPPTPAWEVDAPAPEQDPATDGEPVPDIPWWPLTSSGAPEADATPLPDPVAPPVTAVATQEPVEDDHDGMTILSSDLARLRDRLPSWSQDAVPGPFPTPEPAALPARLVLSTGLVVALDRAVLLGRAPQVARVTNRELPRLVTVPSPNQDVSRTHAEVRVDGEHVVVTDLDSTNGVHVSRPGEGVRRLHPGEPSVVGTDEVVDLGDGVTFTVERSA